MRFIDQVTIEIESGRGGDGRTSFRREKFIPFGGPDGGDGGHGGSVYIQVHPGLNTLVKFRGKRRYKAQDGEAGAKRQMTGAGGEDVVLMVPSGTLIKDADTDQLLADATTIGERILLARGGMGGLGNINFKSSTNQAPRYAQEGKEGVKLNLNLELKLLADIALIGLPNAGKSTLISRISMAKPKIADYPFTTLTPQLGVVNVDDESSLVVVDVPGLIEDASEGKGLGHQFLKHIERASSFVHLIDCSMLLEPYEAFEHYITIRGELEKFNPDLVNKKEIICLTKIDAYSEEEKNNFVKYFEEQLQKKVLPISSVSGENIELLTRLMLKTKEEVSEEQPEKG
jgi:GTPase